MSVYIEFFHGRHTQDEELDEWGFEGPILGPLPYCHITYGDQIMTGEDKDYNLRINSNGLIELMHGYYGDFSVFDRGILKKDPNLMKRWKVTQDYLKTKKSDLPLWVDTDVEWIKHHIEQIFKEANRDRSNTNESSIAHRKNG